MVKDSQHYGGAGSNHFCIETRDQVIQGSNLGAHGNAKILEGGDRKRMGAASTQRGALRQTGLAIFRQHLVTWVAGERVGIL